MLNIHEKIEKAYSIASQDFNTFNDLKKVLQLLELKKTLDLIENAINDSEEALPDEDLNRFEQADELFVDLWSTYSELFNDPDIQAKLTSISPALVNQVIQEKAAEFLSKVANDPSNNEEKHQLAATVANQVASNFSLPE